MASARWRASSGVPSRDSNNFCKWFQVAPILVSEAASVGTEVGRVVATDPDLSRLLVYRLDYNRSEGRREDGALVSPADWQAGRGTDPGGVGRLQLWALIKKKIKFSSYISNFRMEQLQSHIWLTASSSYMGKYLHISSYIRKPFLIYDFATAPLWISLYVRKNLTSSFTKSVSSYPSQFIHPAPRHRRARHVRCTSFAIKYETYSLSLLISLHLWHLVSL